MRPLEGIKVLDFTHVLAGPFATRLLGDMGADIVKINSVVRATAINATNNPYYMMWNRNKRALALDMSRDEAQHICKDLCTKADVVIDNFSVGILDRWGVGYESVSAANPGVIYVQMSGMGQGGPWSEFVTYAPTIHALSGLTHLTGVGGREDIGIGFSYNDHAVGLHGAVAILAAVQARRSTGKGQSVDISQFEVGVNLLGPALLDLFINGRAARPAGNRLPYDEAAPHNCYPCAGAASDDIADERWVAIACLSDDQWEQLRRVMDEPEWSNNPVYETATGRVAAIDELDRQIGLWTMQLDAVDVMARCQAAGVPAGVVQSSIDLAENDPQIAASNFLMTFEEPNPVIGTTYGDRLPITFDATPCDTYTRVRDVGEDNASVLSDWLGMENEEVVRGEEDGYLR
ncbi:MAG: CoA transferase [Pseudomonadales bacterium]